jgi:hypothetical protein
LEPHQGASVPMFEAVHHHQIGVPVFIRRQPIECPGRSPM